MNWTCSVREMRNTYKILVGIPEGKRQFGRIGVDGNITILKWLLTKIVLEGLKVIRPAQNRI
jgi:hypothetical protein